MSGSAFAVTHHAFSSGAGRTSDGNGSHASTLKSPSYTKSVSWQHYLCSVFITSGADLPPYMLSYNSCAFLLATTPDETISIKENNILLGNIKYLLFILYLNMLFF
uniref:Putative transposase n=1 Tax=Shigella flexneri TaxID=623 RepID=A0A2Z2EKL8_SHIFL|nr:putative transposase [Shigella flexneri]